MKTWDDVLAEEKSQPYFVEMLAYIDQQRQAGKAIFPADEDVFNAFTFTAFEKVKVVVLGQDPYHGPDQAHGLSFSVQRGVKIPPSLRNMFKELEQDIPGFTVPTHGNLEFWAQQGVLLLNTVLTVEQGKAHSHAKIGWERFTDKVITLLSENRDGVIFLLWGSHAQRKGTTIDVQKHHVLNAPHPSPLSAHRGFFGCRHFSKVNDLLSQRADSQIDWSLPE